MPRSYWKLHLNSDKEKNAKAIVNRCIKLFDRLPIESEINKYTKGGFMADLQFFHDEEMKWSEVVLEVITLGECLGSGWLLTGKISENPSGILSNQSPSSTIKEAGLNWVLWEIEN